MICTQYMKRSRVKETNYKAAIFVLYPWLFLVNDCKESAAIGEMSYWSTKPGSY